jgi:basic membrane protein A
MKLTRRALTATALAAGLAAGSAMAQDDPFTVGFIHVGSTGDMGWTFTHDQGRIELDEHFGDAVDTVVAESVSESDAARVMTQMILAGADMIVATSFGFGPAVNEVAAQFPDVYFEHATGFMRDHPNVSTYNARFYEGRAISGHLAGHMTDSNIVGYIGSYPIPTVIRGMNSAFIHARQVNPDVEFRVIFVGTWFNPALEADAAQALIDQGADVILQHTDSTAPHAVAQEAGAFAFGQANDMAQFKPAPRISSVIDNWGPYYIARTQAAMDGTWEQVDAWEGLAEDRIIIGEITEAVPEEVRASAMALRDSIATGEYHPFTGPINMQDGTAWLADGELPEDGPLAGMGFFVEGMTAELPN